MIGWMRICFFFQVENFAEIGDPGEAWFGEEAAARMVNWLAGDQHLENLKMFKSLHLQNSTSENVKISTGSLGQQISKTPKIAKFSHLKM